MANRLAFVSMTLLALLLAGCGPARAPSFYMAGSYFPAWLLCAVVGIVGAIVVRIMFIRISLDDILPLRSVVYTCIAFLVAMACALAFFAE